jgi:hypothetical protein
LNKNNKEGEEKIPKNPLFGFLEDTNDEDLQPFPHWTTYCS